MLRLCRKYLVHIQNSVFEGDITEANLEMLKYRVMKIISDDDSVMIYKFRTKNYMTCDVMGEKEKEDPTFI